MDDSKDIGMAFDSPEAILEMRKRHLPVALEMQQIAAKGLSELRQRAEVKEGGKGFTLFKKG